MFTVSLSAASGQTVTAAYTTSDVNATAGADYVATSGTVTFLPGSVSETVTVTVNGDLLNELDETYNVTLSSPVNAAITDPTGLGTITDDDPEPTLSIDDVPVLESLAGAAGTTNAVFTVTLSAASGQQVTVGYATADVSTTAGLDYVTNSGTLTFAPGVTSQTVTVVVNGDTQGGEDPSETFTVTLSVPVNATILGGTGVGTGTITDDDE